jgi:hypothetical protein
MKFINILDSSKDNVYINPNHIVSMVEYYDYNKIDTVYTIISLTNGKEVTTNVSCEDLYSLIHNFRNKI